MAITWVAQKFVMLVIYISIIGVLITAAKGTASQIIRPIFIFGDSSVDVGTNTRLVNCTARARVDHPYYGIDYIGGVATGRFSNGLNPADTIVQLLAGYDISPRPFLALVEDSLNFTKDILHGVNFASGGAGVGKEIGKQLFGQVVSFDEQIQQFAMVQGNITALLGKPKADLLLQESTYIISIGSNDVMTYIFNKSTTPELFIASLTDALAVHLKNLYDLGARKFGILSIPPLGCCPFARVASGGGCDDDINKLASAFYTSFEFHLQNLSSTLEGFKYSLGNSYNMTMNIINNPRGLKNVASACCGTVGPFGLSDCMEGVDLCPNRDDYLFWDGFHPSQKASILAARVLVFSQDQNFVTPVNFNRLRYA